MAIIPQQRLFGWREIDELGDLERFLLVRDHLGGRPANLHPAGAVQLQMGNDLQKAYRCGKSERPTGRGLRI